MSTQSVPEEQEKEAIAMLEQLEQAMKSALTAVDSANECVTHVLAELNDESRRDEIVKEVLQEIADPPEPNRADFF